MRVNEEVNWGDRERRVYVCKVEKGRAKTAGGGPPLCLLACYLSSGGGGGCLANLPTRQDAYVCSCSAGGKKIHTHIYSTKGHEEAECRKVDLWRIVFVLKKF